MSLYRVELIIPRALGSTTHHTTIEAENENRAIIGAVHHFRNLSAFERPAVVSLLRLFQDDDPEPLASSRYIPPEVWE